MMHHNPTPTPSPSYTARVAGHADTSPVEALSPSVPEHADTAALPEVRVCADPDWTVLPVVRLNITDVRMSRADLTAALWRFYAEPAEVLAELHPEAVRMLVVETLLFAGQLELHRAVRRMECHIPATARDEAFLELCERQVELAFGLPMGRSSLLHRALPPYEAWALFCAEYESGTSAPVSPAPAGGTPLASALAEEVAQ